MPTIVSIELGGTGANTAAGARAALGAASAVDSNSSYGQANAAYTQANNAYSQANSAYAAANNAVLKAGDTVTGNLSVAATIISQNIVPNLNVTYNLGSSDKRFKDLYLSNSTIYLGDSTITADGNKLIVPAIETSSGINLESQLVASYSQANAAYTQSNSAYTQANAAYSQANSGYTQANNAYSQANSAYGQANSAYGAANTAQTTAQDAYNQANTATTNAGNAYSQANAAYLQANTAFIAANNSNLKLGGVISGSLNVTNDIIVGGNVYLQGNTTFINVATYQINDSLMYVAANNTLTDSVDIGFVGGKNTSGTFSHTGLARDATDGKYKLFDSLADSGHVGNVIDFANTTVATLVANIEASSMLLSGNAVATNVSVNAAYSQANSAYGAANNRVLKAGDTMTGQLNISSGGLLVTGNVNASSGTLFVDAVNGSVGIGTAEPSGFSGWLTVDGGINIRRFGTDALWIHSDNNNAYIEDLRSKPVHIMISSAERFTFSNNWYLGLNTTSPQASIHIRHPDPRIRLEDQNGGDNIDLYSEYGAGGTIFVIKNSTLSRTDLTIDGSGNVGIGTTSPNHLVHAYANSNSRSKIKIENASSGSNARAELVVNAYGNSWGLGIGAAANNSNAFYINEDSNSVDTTRFTILTGGDVGIGTTSPATRFHVRNHLITVDTTSGSTLTGIYAKWHGSDTGIRMAYLPNSAECFIDSTYPVSSGTVYGDINFRQNVSGTLTSRLFIKGDGGNVGIGTTNPGYKLHAVGSIYASSSLFVGSDAVRISTDGSGELGIGYGQTATNQRFTVYNNTTAAFVVKPNGDVGIGTTSPGAKLHVIGSSSPGILSIEDSTSGATTTGAQLTLFRASTTSTQGQGLGIRFQDSAVVNNIRIIESGGGALQFIAYRSGWVTDMFINSSGNVGIGTTSPGAKLDIEGSGAGGLLHINNTTAGKSGMAFQDNGNQKLIIGLAGYWEGNSSTDAAIATESGSNIRFYTNGSPTERMRINTSGNVGIGTTNPSAKLQVDGNVETTWGFYRFAAIYDNTYRMGMYFNANGRTLQLFSTSGDSAGDISFSTRRGAGSSDSDYGTERVRILSNGNVGIGTGSPDVKLEVDGHVSIRGSSNLYWGQSTSSVGSWTTKQYASGSTHYFNAQAFHFTNEGYGSDTFAVITTSGIRPGVDNTKDLGTASFRWANLYTGDLHLSNKGKQNDVDGTWGEWTIQEGEENLYVINRRTGKKFKIKMEEV